MKKQEWTYVDRSSWKNKIGPWEVEPDKKQWLDEETGLPCLIVRGPSGALCGYVGVNGKHPFYEKSYNDIRGIDVHGGLTFSNKCNPYEEIKGICHIVEKDDDDDMWWLGFDCNHLGDFAPSYDSYGSGEYQDIHYVENQCKYLAIQLSEYK